MVINPRFLLFFFTVRYLFKPFLLFDAFFSVVTLLLPIHSYTEKTVVKVITIVIPSLGNCEINRDGNNFYIVDADNCCPCNNTTSFRFLNKLPNNNDTILCTFSNGFQVAFT